MPAPGPANAPWKAPHSPAGLFVCVGPSAGRSDGGAIDCRLCLHGQQHGSRNRTQIPGGRPWHRGRPDRRAHGAGIHRRQRHVGAGAHRRRHRISHAQGPGTRHEPGRIRIPDPAGRCRDAAGPALRAWRHRQGALHRAGGGLRLRGRCVRRPPGRPVTAEIELASEDIQPPSPAWLGAEVTSDLRYSNSQLAKTRQLPSPALLPG